MVEDPATAPTLRLKIQVLVGVVDVGVVGEARRLERPVRPVERHVHGARGLLTQHLGDPGRGGVRGVLVYLGTPSLGVLLHLALLGLGLDGRLRGCLQHDTNLSIVVLDDLSELVQEAHTLGEGAVLLLPQVQLGEADQIPGQVLARSTARGRRLQEVIQLRQQFLRVALGAVLGPSGRLGWTARGRRGGHPGGP